MFEDVLGWTDVNNNKAFFGEQISCTNNASSILEVGIRDFPDIAKVTDHALNPQGPKGRFHVFNAQSHAILTHARDQAAAKNFLRWLYDDKQLSRWLVSANAYYAPFLQKYDNHPMWNAEPRYIPYKECAQDLAAARVAWPARPPGLGERGQVRGGRHVRQGLPRRRDQGRHRHGGDAAEADLQSEVARWRSGPARSLGAPGRGPAAARCAACSSARASSRG